MNIKISKYIKNLAIKYNLEVKASIQKGEYNSTYKVYHFYGNFLCNFEAFTKEIKGYEKSNEFNYSIVKIK